MESNPVMIEPIRKESGREIMRTPDEVTAIVELHRTGWGAKRIALELGITKNTVNGTAKLADGSRTGGRLDARCWMNGRSGLPSNT